MMTTYVGGSLWGLPPAVWGALGGSLGDLWCRGGGGLGGLWGLLEESASPVQGQHPQKAAGAHPGLLKVCKLWVTWKREEESHFQRCGHSKRLSMELTSAGLWCTGPKDLKPVVHRRVARLSRPLPRPPPSAA